MNKYFTLLFGATVAIAATAAPRTQQQAMALAAQKAAMQGATLQAPHSQALTAMPNHMGNDNKQQPYYTFDKVGGGYIIVSGEDSMPAIVGYTDSGTFDPDQLPDGLKIYLEAYADLSARVAAGEATIDDEVQNDYPVVDQLLGQTEWDQGAPYFNMCPIYTTTDEETGEVTSARCLTGCVATAASQIIYYHKYAVQTRDIPAYVTRTLKIEMPAIPMGDDYANLFDWENMLPQYKNVEATEEQQAAVAKLMAYVGSAQQMNYTPTFSGAGEEGAFRSFVTLGYDTTLLQLAKHRDYTKAGWLRMINNELRHERPIFYTGYAGSSGHAFVLDGCDADGLYHINWGWSGFGNGNFDITILDPNYTSDSDATHANSGYSVGNVMVLGITPQNVAGEQQYVPDFAELADYSKLDVDCNLADGTKDFFYNPYYTYYNKLVASFENQTGRELNDVMYANAIELSDDGYSYTDAVTLLPVILDDGESVELPFDMPSPKEEMKLGIEFFILHIRNFGFCRVEMKPVGLPDLVLSLESNGTEEFIDEEGVTCAIVNDTVATVDFKIINNGAAYRGQDFALGIGGATFGLMEIPEGESHYTFSKVIPEDEPLGFTFYTNNQYLPTTCDYQYGYDYRCRMRFVRADVITGIQQVRPDRQTTGRRYNLQGQVVGEGYRGVFISK